MAPLFLEEVVIGHTIHQVGLLGCTLSASVLPAKLLEITQQIAMNHQLEFLLVDADRVASADHLLFATIHALTAFHHGTQRASTLTMEILRFTAAQRQISEALDLLGISESTEHLGGVLITSKRAQLEIAYATFLKLANATDDSSVLDLTSVKKEKVLQSIFQISTKELNTIAHSNRVRDRRSALQKLVYDRCALLAITR